MGFHEISFPVELSFGMTGGPGHRTDIIITGSGHEQRVVRWSGARNRYEIPLDNRPQSEVGQLIRFVRARQGAANGWRLQDPNDYTSALDGVSAHADDDVDPWFTASGADPSVVQLFKRYADSAGGRTRTIHKPQGDGTAGDGSVLIARNGSPYTDFTYDPATGLVTLNNTTDTDLFTCGFAFDVPVRFSEDVDEALEATYTDFDNVQFPNLSAVEELNPAIVADEFHYGGAAEFTLTADISISPLTGRYIRIVSASTGGLKVLLPEVDTLAPGGPYFYIFNDADANTVLLRDENDAAVITMGTNSHYTVLLSSSAAGKAWVAYNA
jgi:uncharacterized protein (TIGR02217 family)